MENRRQSGRPREQYNPRNTPRRNLPRQKREPEHKDRLLGMLCFQIGICVLGLALLLTARFLGGESFVSAREIAAGLCGVGQEEVQLPDLPEIHLEGALQQVSQLFGQLKDALAEAIHKNIAPPQEQEEPPSPETIGESAPYEEEHSLQTATGLQAVKNRNTRLAGQAGGQGGWNPVKPSIDPMEMMEPPAYASFSPYLLSAALWTPAAGQITSPFGYRLHPITEEADFHSGIDIASPEGAAVHAALPGVVEETGWSDSYGNYVKLRHSSRLVTTYSHCSKLLAEEGEKIARGDRIALIGSTGISTGPHLHFEILIDGKKVDPLSALQKQLK